MASRPKGAVTYVSKPSWHGKAANVTAQWMGNQMILFFKSKSVCSRLARRRRLAGIFAGTALAACVGGAAVAQAPEKIPDLGSSSRFAWTPLTVNGGIARYGTGWFDPPAGLRGPIKQHPDYPLRGNETGRPTPARAPSRAS
jgi:hypothetical protein